MYILKFFILIVCNEYKGLLQNKQYNYMRNKIFKKGNHENILKILIVKYK